MVSNPRCNIWRYFVNIVEEGVAVCKLCNQRLKNDRSFGLRYHIKSLHNPDSNAWKHYDNSRSTEGIAICKICSRHVKTNRLFNLIVHMKSHGIIVEENEKVTSSVETQLNGQKVEKESTDESFYVYLEKKTLVNAIIGLMIDEGVTPELFASENMQALLDPLCKAISAEEDINFTINEVKSGEAVYSIANFIREEISNQLQSRLLSLRIDMDTNNVSKTFYVTAQYINELEVEKRILGEVTLNVKQELTEQSIVEILHKFNIDSQQVVSAYWDDSKARIQNMVTNAEYLQEMEKFERGSNIKLGNVIVGRYIGVVSQLCVFDVLKSLDIYPLFMVCRNLTKYINENLQLFSESFKQHSLNIPQLDSPWKWGSTYKMMNELLQSLFALENIKFEQPESPEDRFTCNEQLTNFIAAFCNSFSCIQKCAQRFYNSEMIFGDFYAQWLKCKLLTGNILKSSEPGSIAAIISGELLRSIENRTKWILDQDHFKACLYLDPRFQHTLQVPDKLSAMTYLNQLWTRFKSYNVEFANRFTETEQEVPQPVKIEDDEDACLNEFLSQCVSVNVSTGIYRRLEDLKLPFQTADTSPLAFWKVRQFVEPEIYKLAIICFAIPTTQNWNALNEFLDDKQKQQISDITNLCPTIKNNLELIRTNKHLLDKAIDKFPLFTEGPTKSVDMDNMETATSSPVPGSPHSSTVFLN